jgi:hypothetical protein
MASASDVSARLDQNAHLENALIAEFLEKRGFTDETLSALPASERHHLLEEASIWASSRLAEVESRAHFVHDLHHND